MIYQKQQDWFGSAPLATDLLRYEEIHLLADKAGWFAGYGVNTGNAALE
ncbi:MAG: hypothetical protein ACPGGK_12250 [Pikeienuella sp.]